MKKWIALLCAMALLLCMLTFVGCGGGEETPEGEEPEVETPGGDTPGGGETPGGETPGGNPDVPKEEQGGNDPYVPDIEW